MKKQKALYKKPSLTIRKVKANFFLSNVRLFDSFDELLAPSAFAQTWDCGCSCFIKGTKILMENESTKNIEELESGDVVYSYDTRENTKVKNTIEMKLTHYGFENGYLLLNNSLKVTPNHPMWIPKTKKWVRADSLKVGSEFIDSNGKITIIRSIQKKEGTFDVYNLHLSKSPHNFFAENFLVHNQSAQIDYYTKC